MVRRTLLAVSVALAAALTTSNASAAEFWSGSSTIASVDQIFSFDFNSSDFGSLGKNDLLVGVGVDWNVKPGAGSTGSTKLIGDVLVSGQPTGVGLQIDLDQSKGLAHASANNFASTGLVYSAPVLTELFDSGKKLNGQLGILLTNASAFVDFFNAGGSIDGKLQLQIIPREAGTGGGGSPVPEPASLLVWAAVGGAGLLMRRRLANRKAATT